jgi:transposase
MLEACTGYMNEHKIYMLQQIRECNEQLQERTDELDKRIKEILAPYSEIVEKLREIPGIQDRTCEDLIAEIGLDMGNFPTSAHLCSWAGMCPGNNESAGKKKSGRTSHGDKHVRTVLVEAAWAASRTKGTFFKERFQRLALRRGTKKSINSRRTFFADLRIPRADWGKLQRTW